MEDGRKAGSVGFSDRITDAAFQQASARQTRQGLRYLWVLLPLAALVLLWRMGAIATALFIVLLPVLAAFGLAPLIKSRRTAADATYDGEVESVERREPVSSADVRSIGADVADRMILHTIRIRDDHGRLHTYERMGGPEDYRAYYRPGERVRHHRGFDLPEKYDKRGDDTAVCIVCGRMESTDAGRCTACGAPLLQ